ncbi:hypothetical protein F2Q69_00023254 [Brassica cretica]|uniref:Uncharacterized protein n=1 Tax=Brassica cretica TaxID=69181 RepID=A0A8S9Q0Q3_BRACR|nr:hypothetical protein F2Q69_00023254 [Brassica cretica]
MTAKIRAASRCHVQNKDFANSLKDSTWSRVVQLLKDFLSPRSSPNLKNWGATVGTGSHTKSIPPKESGNQSALTRVGLKQARAIS